MALLDNFTSEMNRRLQVLENQSIYDPTTGTYTDDWVVVGNEGGYPCVIYSKAIAEKYFGQGMWNEAVKYVACLKPFPFTVTGDNQVMVDDVRYAIDTPDDVAFQGEVLLIAMRPII